MQAAVWQGSEFSVNLSARGRTVSRRDSGGTLPPGRAASQQRSAPGCPAGSAVRVGQLRVLSAWLDAWSKVGLTEGISRAGLHVGLAPGDPQPVPERALNRRAP